MSKACEAKFVWIVWQLDYMKALIYTLYKVKIDVFSMNKMFYGIFSFSCGNTFGLSV